MEVKVGDVVVWKSGGPAMTIIFIDEDGAYCIWFNKNDERFGAYFKPELLRLYSEL